MPLKERVVRGGGGLLICDAEQTGPEREGSKPPSTPLLYGIIQINQVKAGRNEFHRGFASWMDWDSTG